MDRPCGVYCSKTWLVTRRFWDNWDLASAVVWHSVPVLTVSRSLSGNHANDGLRTFLKRSELQVCKRIKRIESAVINCISKSCRLPSTAFVGNGNIRPQCCNGYTIVLFNIIRVAAYLRIMQ